MMKIKTQNNLSALSIERLKKVLVQDKLIGSNMVINLLKSDLINLLQGYLDIDKKDIDLQVQVDNGGEYSISLSAKACRIKTGRAILS